MSFLIAIVGSSFSALGNYIVSTVTPSYFSWLLDRKIVKFKKLEFVCLMTGVSLKSSS